MEIRALTNKEEEVTEEHYGRGGVLFMLNYFQLFVYYY